jgi:hypothetical protein
MRVILSERNLVVVLFVMVLITFSLAQEDTKKMQPVYTGINTSARSSFASLQKTEKKSFGEKKDASVDNLPR